MSNNNGIINNKNFDDKRIYIDIGLDISSSIIGLVFIDTTTKELLLMEPLNLLKYDTIYQKASYFRNQFKELLNKFSQKFPNETIHVNNICIEASAKMFQGGKTSAETLSKLHKMNALASFLAYEECIVFINEQYENKIIIPLYIISDPEIKETNVTSARSKIGFKKDKTSKLKIKEQVFEWVINKYPNLPLPTKTLKRDTKDGLKGSVVYDESAKDCVDAFVICRGTQIINGNK